MDFEKIVAELQGRIEGLEQRLSGNSEPEIIREPDDPKDRADYVERGSERHAGMLGLRKAEKGDELQVNGWAFQDGMQFDFGFDPAYHREILRQRASDLTAPVPTMQSDDPRKPHYAQKMWVAPKRTERISW